MAMDSGAMTMPMTDPNAWATAMNNLGMAPMGLTGQPLMPGTHLYDRFSTPQHCNFSRCMPSFQTLLSKATR